MSRQKSSPSASEPVAFGAAKQSMPDRLTLALPITDELVEALAHRVAELVQPEVTPLRTWVDTRGAAEHLATSPDRIRDLVQLGRLRPARDGRRLLFRITDLDAYVEDRAA